MNTADRLWSLGAGIVALAVGAGGWFLAVSPDITATAVARADLEMVEQQNSLHEVRIAQLEEAAARIAEFESSRDELAQGVPGELRYAEFVRQLDALAEQAGVTIVGVTAAEALRYLPPEPAEAPPAPVPADAGAPSADGAATGEAVDPAATADAATEAAVAGPMPYIDPLIGPQNLSAVPITITATGGTAELQAFLNSVQMGSRLVSVSTATFAVEPDAVSGAGTQPDAESDSAAVPEQVWRTDIGGFLYVLQPEATAP